MLNPSDSVVDWVVETVSQLGAGWCPPGMLGIGIGGTVEKAALMAKESLMEDIDIQELIARGASCKEEELRIELYHKINQLGIGAQGLGGLARLVLDVKSSRHRLMPFPCQLPLSPIVRQHGISIFTLDGSGPADLIL